MPDSRFTFPELEIAKGNLPHHSAVHKFGHVTGLDTTRVTVWDQASLYSYLSAATQLKISSSNAKDTAGGVGARDVLITGLDANYDEITEQVNLNGLTAVLTTQSFLRVFRMQVLGVGDELDNAGVIYAGTGTVTDGIPENVYSIIEAGMNQTLQAFYTVPAGKTAYLISFTAQTDSAKAIDAFLFVRKPGQAFAVKDLIHMNQTAPPRTRRIPEAFTEKSDIEIRAVAGASGADVSAQFELVLVDNDRRT